MAIPTYRKAENPAPPHHAHALSIEALFMDDRSRDGSVEAVARGLDPLG